MVEALRRVLAGAAYQRAALVAQDVPAPPGDYDTVTQRAVAPGTIFMDITPVHTPADICM